MSTAWVWILLPAAAALVLLLLRRWRLAVCLAAGGLALLLVWLAWRAPFEQVIVLGPWTFRLEDTWQVFGRRFVLGEADRPLLIILYLSAAFWFFGALAAQADALFVPLGLAVVAVLVAAQAVEPFLYAALFLELAVLISVPLLAPPGQRTRPGVVRFLTFQTLGMPFILYSGRLLEGVAALDPAAPRILQITLLVGMGVAFLLAIFPFHTWIPMLGEEAHPYAAAFIFYIMPLGVLLAAMGFLEQYPWLRQERLLEAMRLIGAIMALVGGAWAGFQRHLGRMMGFFTISENGLALIAISGWAPGGASTPAGDWFLALLLPRAVSLGLLAMALQILTGVAAGERISPNMLRFRTVEGLGRSRPVAAGTLLLACLSLAGFPMLAGFPARLGLLNQTAADSPGVAAAVLLGSAGLFIGAARATLALVRGSQPAPWTVSETWGQVILLGAGVTLLVVIGLAPQWFLPPLVQLSRLMGGAP